MTDRLGRDDGAATMIRYLPLFLVLISTATMADPGDVDARHQAALAFAADEDFDSALPIWHALAAEGNAEAQTELGRAYHNASGVERDYKEAMRLYRLAAEQGNARATANIGVMYLYGLGVDKAPSEALVWHRAAAELGSARAQLNTGYQYEHGLGAPQDLAQAARYYRSAAGQGNRDAQRNLANFYLTGRGVEQDDSEAVRWYRLSVEQGDPDAQFILAMLVGQGRGTQQDNDQRMRLLRLSAAQGHATAQNRLGQHYARNGESQDYGEALKWFTLSAEQGDTDSQLAVGQMYEKGLGIPKDFVSAKSWYERSTEAGSAKGHYLLGQAYWYGRGVKVDAVKAYQLNQTAAENGYEDAVKLSQEANFKNIRVMTTEMKDGVDLAIVGIDDWLENGGDGFCDPFGLKTGHDVFWSTYQGIPRAATVSQDAAWEYYSCMIGLSASGNIWGPMLIDQDQARSDGAFERIGSADAMISAECTISREMAANHNHWGDVASRVYKDLSTCSFYVAQKLQVLAPFRR